MVESPVVARPGLMRGVVRRRWITVLALTAIGGAAGFAATQALPTTYTATASLFLEPLSGNPFSPTTAATRNEQIAALETEVALLSTTDVGERAAVVAGTGDIPAGEVSASVASNSQVLDLSFTAADPADAQRFAGAYAEAFLEYRRDRSDRISAEQRDALEDQLDETSVLLSETTGRLARAAEGTAAYVQLEQQVQLYASQFSDLQVQLLALASAADNAGEIISPAALPTGPDGVGPVVLIAAGLLLGAAAGATVGLYREHRDPRVHSVEEVAALGVGPALAVLRCPEKGVPSQEDGYGTLEAFVIAALPDRGGVVALVGVDAAADATAAALGLAGALVRSGRPCTVVLADQDAGVSSGRTLSDALDDRDPVPIDQLGQELEDGLRLVRTGAGPGDTTAASTDADDLLQREQTREVLRALAADRLVVVAAPPMPRGAALWLSRCADRAVLLLRLGESRFDASEEAVHSLGRSGGDLLGVAAQARGRCAHGPLDGITPAKGTDELDPATVPHAHSDDTAARHASRPGPSGSAFSVEERSEEPAGGAVGGSARDRLALHPVRGSAG